MRNDKNSYVKIVWTILIVFLAIHYWDMLFSLVLMVVSAAIPLVVGLAIAYVVNILMNFYERKYIIICRWSAIRRWRRQSCLFLSFLTLILMVDVLWQMIFPALAACIRTFWESLPWTLDKLTQWLQGNMSWCCTFLEKQGFMKDGIVDWKGLIQIISAAAFHGYNDSMESIVAVFSTFFSFIVTILLAIVFAVYLLLRKEKLKKDSSKLLIRCIGEPKMRRIWHILDVFNDAFHSFIVGQCVEAVILGSLCMVGMFLFRFPYAAMIGSLVGFTALIPLAGAYIGAIVGGLMIFTVSPVQALFFLIFLTILQQLENNLIYPRVVGSSIGLPGIWVLAAVIVGGSVAGILGMMVAVPTTAALYKLFREWLDKEK